MTLLIQAANICHAHGGNQIFEDATFEVREGDRLALIGPNGAGKSTLFQIMAKLIAPDGGAVTHRRGLTVGYLSQESSIDPELTMRQAVAFAAGDPTALEARLRELETRMAEPLDDAALTAVMDEYAATLARLESAPPEEENAKGAAVLAGLHLPEERWDTPVGRLSGGEKKLVGLAQLLVAEPEVLQLDEPDNHLDLGAKAWLEGYVRAHRGAVAIISHDRYLIDRAVNEIFELEDGRVVTYPGTYTAFVEEKQRRLERQAQLRELQEREFKKLKASAEQLTQWARQNPKFAPRAENQRRKMAEERERLEQTPPPILNRRRINVDFDAERGSTLVLEAKGLAKSFGARQVLRPFDLTIRHGEVVGVIGPNGSGKSTLFRLVLGQEQPSSGTLRIGPSIVVGYYAQEQETLDRNQTPLEMVRRLKSFTEQQGISFLSGLLFDRGDMLNPIGNLSGGERARLQVAALILGGANFLLLDEPTNNLDIASTEVLESALLDFQGSILAISHDRYFLDKLCTRTVELRDGIVRDYPGGFSSYEANRGHGTGLTIRVPVPAARGSR
ncbi:MAG: ribosomal protection-like ABC-F family protein [Thermomicrobiales bacterium]